MSNVTVNNMQQEINRLRTGRKVKRAIAETSQACEETCQTIEETSPVNVPAVSDTSADIRAEIEALRKENEALKNAANSPLKMKVSGKGAVSVYGLGKWPLTLYGSQWNKLMENVDAIKSFIGANAARLASKEGQQV